MNAARRINKLLTRPMELDDLPAVLIVEDACYSHPWTVGNFRDCVLAGYHCVLAEIDGTVCGHGVMSVAAGEAHLLNISIHPQFQGCGAGRSLLHRLILMAGAAGADTMFLEVRASNHVAQQLYLSEGFNEIGHRRDYYPLTEGRREDALVFARALLDR
jgi:ribosomal-protein-alanine N-acetyltransferase